jgi:hypothetical protein
VASSVVVLTVDANRLFIASSATGVRRRTVRDNYTGVMALCLSPSDSDADNNDDRDNKRTADHDHDNGAGDRWRRALCQYLPAVPRTAGSAHQTYIKQNRSGNQGCRHGLWSVGCAVARHHRRPAVKHARTLPTGKGSARSPSPVPVESAPSRNASFREFRFWYPQWLPVR